MKFIEFLVSVLVGEYSKLLARCEFCCEDIPLKDLKLCYEVGNIEDLIGRRIYCIFCENDFIVTREHIYRYHRLVSSVN